MGMAKIKVACSLVLVTGITELCVTSAYHVPFESDARRKKWTFYIYRYSKTFYGIVDI